jgi:hypothetical protein
VTFDYTFYPNFARDKRKILKQFPKALEDLSRLEKNSEGKPLLQVAFPVRDKPADLPEMWKFYVGVKAANLSPLKGMRLLVERHGEVLRAMALYTHKEYPNQPGWAEMRKWIKEESASPDDDPANELAER